MRRCWVLPDDFRALEHEISIRRQILPLLNYFLHWTLTLVPHRGYHSSAASNLLIRNQHVADKKFACVRTGIIDCNFDLSWFIKEIGQCLRL